MDSLTATYEVFSPRWGHSDQYTVTFAKDELRVTHGSNLKNAVCRVAENGDPEWVEQGYSEDNPLMDMFSNDHIYPPEIVPDALAWAWRKWSKNAVSEQELQSAIAEMFSWIDQTARSTPSSSFWMDYF